LPLLAFFGAERGAWLLTQNASSGGREAWRAPEESSVPGVLGPVRRCAPVARASHLGGPVHLPPGRVNAYRARSGSYCRARTASGKGGIAPLGALQCVWRPSGGLVGVLVRASTPPLGNFFSFWNGVGSLRACASFSVEGVREPALGQTLALAGQLCALKRDSAAFA
jgi:hypothetical protein